jgi:hypothetical protein
MIMNLNRKGKNGKIGKPKKREFLPPCLPALVPIEGGAGRSRQGRGGGRAD